MSTRAGEGDPCGDGRYPTPEETFAKEIDLSRRQWAATTRGKPLEPSEDEQREMERQGLRWPGGGAVAVARDWAVLGRVGSKRQEPEPVAPAPAEPVNEEWENWSMRHDHSYPCDAACAGDPRPWLR